MADRTHQAYPYIYGQYFTPLTAYNGNTQPYSTPPVPNTIDQRTSVGLCCIYQTPLELLYAHPERDPKAKYALPQAESHYFVSSYGEVCSVEPVVNQFKYSPDVKSAGRALCIGINYFNQKGAMRGRTDEARSLCEYLRQVKHYAAGSVILLTDDQTGLFGQPTKRNILNALSWLGEYAFQGERIVISYSGHGQLPVIGHDKSSGTQIMHNDTGSMYPVDFRYFEGGIIKAEELEKFLIPIKRKGAKLTFIFDTQVGIDNTKSTSLTPS